MHCSCLGPVLPADLLALGVGASAVRDAHLVHPPAASSDLGRDLRLEAETVLLDGDRRDHLPAEHLVAGLHVGQVEVGGHVGKKRQEVVAHRVPEVEDPMGASALEARAVDHVRLPVDDRLHQQGKLVGVVLQVGILDDDDVARGRLKTGAQRRSFAQVLGVVEHLGDEGGDPVLEDGAGAVGGAVVHHDDLGVTEGRLADPVDDALDSVPLVVAGDDDAEPQVRRWPSVAPLRAWW